MSHEIIVKPIGVIRTPFKTPSDLKVPPYKSESPYNDPNITGTIEVFEGYCEGIADIIPGSKGMLIFHFDRSSDYDLTTISHRTKQKVGVFSTRSPRRPNGIGVTIVTFTKSDGCTLTFQGVDMLDGTPLLDIKPYNDNVPAG